MLITKIRGSGTCMCMGASTTQRTRADAFELSRPILLSAPKLLAWSSFTLKSAFDPRGPMQHSPRGERPGSARPTARPVQRPGSARPRGAENRQVERFAVGPKMRPDELPKFGLQYHAKFPERRPQSASPRSPRSPRNASPRGAPLTTARVQSSHGFEPAGFKHPWGGLPDTKRLPWMQYGAQCTMKERPTSAHAANRAPAEFHKAVMKEFVDAANADGELDDAERLALTSAKVATA